MLRVSPHLPNAAFSKVCCGHILSLLQTLVIQLLPCMFCERHEGRCCVSSREKMAVLCHMLFSSFSKVLFLHGRRLPCFSARDSRSFMISFRCLFQLPTALQDAILNFPYFSSILVYIRNMYFGMFGL